MFTLSVLKLIVTETLETGGIEVKVLVISKRVKWWTSGVALLKPCGLTVKIYNPAGLDEQSLFASLRKELSPMSKVLVICEVLPLYKEMPQAVTLPCTVSTAQAFVSLTLDIYKSLKEGKEFPSLCLLLPQELQAELESEVVRWGFRVVPLEGSGKDTYYLVGIRGVTSVPENRSILIPNQGAATAFATYITELLYSYAPFDVVEEKRQEEAELGRKELLQRLEKRRGRRGR